MTQEQKAKAYDEALAKCKAYIEDTTKRWSEEFCKATETVFEEIFPELAESEDERIRKALIDGVRQIRCKNGITHEQMIAYLEKQKDASKAIEAVERIDKYIDEHLANAHDMKDSNPDKKYYRGWDDALAKMSGILQDVYSEEKQKDYRELYEDIAQSEWFKKAYVGKSLGEQNPAEWSEEDEEMLEYVIGDVNDAKELFATKEAIDLCDKEIAWLKSLRPVSKESLQSWKPSEDEKSKTVKQ